MKDARYFDNGQLVIFRREGGNVFHLRTKLDGKYVWRSLHTTSMEEAIARAWKLHHGLQALHEQGLPVTAKTFASVIEDYVRTREKSCKQGKTTPAMLRQVRRVVKFWLEYPVEAGNAAIKDGSLAQTCSRHFGLSWIGGIICTRRLVPVHKPSLFKAVVPPEGSKSGKYRSKWLSQIKS